MKVPSVPLMFVLGLLAVAAAGERAAGQSLLEYGTNRGKVVEVELNYMPDRAHLAIAVTLDNRFVKKAQYTGDGPIRNVLELVKFKDRGKLRVVYEGNTILSFHVID